MIPNKRQRLLFTAASVLTAAVWTTFQKQHKPIQIAPEIVRTTESTSPHLGEILSTLQTANSDAERYRIARKLEKIPLSEIRIALESIPLKEDSGLTQSAKLMLNRWGAEDGKAAAEWAWQHLRMDQLWHDAFQEIGPAWAWRDPDRLAAWALATPATTTSIQDDLSVADGAALEKPVLESDLVIHTAQWLAPESMELAFKVLVHNGLLSHYRTDKIYARIKQVADVKAALLAFDLTEEVADPVTHKAIERLFMRWRDLDVEDFRQSEYADRFELPPYRHIDSDVILITQPSTTFTPTPYPQATSWYSNYERWKYSNGPMPDMSNWSAGKKQAWQDLQALLPEADERF